MLGDMAWPPRPPSGIENVFGSAGVLPGFIVVQRIDQLASDEARSAHAMTTVSPLVASAGEPTWPSPAMRCGVPIVTSRINGLAEIAGDAAILVDPGNPADIADGICRVLTEPGLRELLSARGLERARLFSWESCAQRTLEILERVGSGQSRSALVGQRT